MHIITNMTTTSIIWYLWWWSRNMQLNNINIWISGFKNILLLLLQIIQVRWIVSPLVTCFTIVVVVSFLSDFSLCFQYLRHVLSFRSHIFLWLVLTLSYDQNGIRFMILHVLLGCLQHTKQFTKRFFNLIHEIVNDKFMILLQLWL